MPLGPAVITENGLLGSSPKPSHRQISRMEFRKKMMLRSHVSLGLERVGLESDE